MLVLESGQLGLNSGLLVLEPGSLRTNSGQLRLHSRVLRLESSLLSLNAGILQLHWNQTGSLLWLQRHQRSATGSLGGQASLVKTTGWLSREESLRNRTDSTGWLSWRELAKSRQPVVLLLWLQSKRRERRVGQDLVWVFRNRKRDSINKALDFVLPFFGQVTWQRLTTKRQVTQVQRQGKLWEQKQPQFVCVGQRPDLG